MLFYNTKNKIGNFQMANSCNISCELNTDENGYLSVLKQGLNFGNDGRIYSADDLVEIAENTKANASLIPIDTKHSNTKYQTGKTETLEEVKGYINATDYKIENNELKYKFSLNQCDPNLDKISASFLVKLNSESDAFFDIIKIIAVSVTDNSNFNQVLIKNKGNGLTLEERKKLLELQLKEIEEEEKQIQDNQPSYEQVQAQVENNKARGQSVKDETIKSLLSLIRDGEWNMEDMQRVRATMELNGEDGSGFMEIENSLKEQNLQLAEKLKTAMQERDNLINQIQDNEAKLKEVTVERDELRDSIQDNEFKAVTKGLSESQKETLKGLPLDVAKNIISSFNQNKTDNVFTQDNESENIDVPTEQADFLGSKVQSRGVFKRPNKGDK
jgi:F0F1-type ATP synthase membrane subunit b/b'